jgi:hypothetical protein
LHFRRAIGESRAMRAFGRWLFGDIASVVAPRVERGPRRTPTRRSARWLIGFGVFLTLFGAMGFAAEAGAKLERQPATVLLRYTTRMHTSAGTSRIHKLRLLLEDGTTKNVPHAPLYDAVGTRTDLPVTVDIDPDNDLVDAIYLEGHRYATGRQSAAVVIMFLFLASGVFVLLRGIGRRRRSRLVAVT